ncbi:MAG TPA: VOC family protein [Bacteroidia bacterium]|nr:VOC family protein [Bacteroidia bacterium]
MKKQYSRRILVALAITGAFGLGFTSSQLLSEKEEKLVEGRVTGIGGIFFKSSNPEELKLWYKTYLGLNTGPYGTTFKWYQGADSTKMGFTQWGAFKSTTKYFEPSKKEFMINYRVDNLAALMKKFDGKVIITDTVETYDYGKFVHIMDPEGNKIELWEPIDEVYGKIEGEVTK